ncbi:hypothetical protein F6X38_10305 [Aureimonas leprariae]|uniref:Uncharacterized protein n=2 Tax=Plantimonas leprariae TaxID=2615207 RepID=A0A7V7U012_9HYPH|nr:hypothetical protein F6X38_10305 [Aureimonas leprariae]
MSQRLLAVLTGEVRGFEWMIRASAAAESQGEDGASPAGAKARVDAIGSLTKTLEKLIDLGRVELAAAKGGAEEESEAVRLRAELMKRLRAIDARRGSGRRLFGDAAEAAGFA